MKIFSLGTSNRTKEEFIDILRNYKIEIVVDVRHFPTSKFFPHFKKENLEKILKEKKINYYHIEKLGGYRKGGYQSYTKTKEFKEGLNELISLFNNKNLAIICAERFPWKCHRFFCSKRTRKFRI